MAIIDGYPATSFSAKDRAWVKAVADNSADKVLPDVTAADNGKILGVDSGEWNKVDAPSGLPSVTAADNGKILGVDNGAWSKVDAPSGGIDGVFWVHLTETEEGLETVETVGEIWNAISEGYMAYTAGNGLQSGVIYVSQVGEPDADNFVAQLLFPPDTVRSDSTVQLVSYSYETEGTPSVNTFVFTWDSEIEAEFSPSTN